MSFLNEDETYVRARSNTWPRIRNDLPEVKSKNRRYIFQNFSYGDLITIAIKSSPRQRLMLSEIYDWLIENVPPFRQKSDRVSSAGWKNSIRHNLSLHSKFVKVENEVPGKSCWWTVDYQPDRQGRRRCTTMDNQKAERKRHIAQRTVKMLMEIKEGKISDFSENKQNEHLQQGPTRITNQLSMHNTHCCCTNTEFEIGTNYKQNTQANQRYDNMVTDFQQGMTMYYPYPHMSQSPHFSASSNGTMYSSSSGAYTPAENNTNLDDINLELDQFNVPLLTDIDAIIRRELEIDGYNQQSPGRSTY